MKRRAVVDEVTLAAQLKPILRPFFEQRGYSFHTHMELARVIGRVLREIKKEREDGGNE